MDEDAVALIIGFIGGAVIGGGIVYFIVNQKKKVIIGRNKEGQIDSIIEE
ncbi:hypothetical protein [Mycobacterium sp.]